MKNRFLYRIFRLRRLIISSLLVLFIPWGVGWQLFGPSALLESPERVVATSLICVSIVLALVLVYPRAWWETLTTALVLGIVLMLLPVLEVAPEFAPVQNRGKATAVVIVVAVLGSFFLWLGLNWLPVVSIRLPIRSREWRSRIQYDTSADRAFEILKTTPNSFDGKYKTGPVGEDGLFTVSTSINTINLDTWDPENEQLLYKCRIEQEGDNSQVISAYFMVEDEAEVAVEHLNVWSVGQQANCEMRSMKNRQNIHEFLGFWIQDYGADHMYDRLQRAESGTSVALVDLPYKTPLFALARFFERFNEEPPGQGGRPL